MFSHADLRHMLEKAFLPTLCECTITVDGVMTLALLNPESHAQEMEVAGIRIAEIQNGRALAELVREVKRESLLRKTCGQNQSKRAG